MTETKPLWDSTLDAPCPDHDYASEICALLRWAWETPDASLETITEGNLRYLLATKGADTYKVGALDLDRIRALRLYLTQGLWLRSLS